MKKEIGYIGLGKMGKNMVFRLIEKGWDVAAYDTDEKSVEEVKKKGGRGAASLGDLAAKIPSPRIVWLMVPHRAVDETLRGLMPLLQKGDLVIDGGNSPYQETKRRAKEAEEKGIGFLDVGVSGGPGGARNGASMMAGGTEESYTAPESSGFFGDACVPGGYGYMGASGARHFVKMVHNGIEYGMMQSIAEGFDLLRHSTEYDLDLEKITGVYSHGSVITSRLVSWLSEGYKKYGKDLKEISGKAGSLGEGHWAAEAGKREGVPMPAIEAALRVREASQKEPSYQGKVISTLRGEFGGHPVKRGDDEPDIV